MVNKEETKKAHNAIAKQYYEAYKDDVSDLVYFDEFLSLFNGSVLDLGCGMGHYSDYMYKKGFEVLGVDFSSEMIKFAKKINSKIEFIESDICELSLIKNKVFDGVVIAYVLQHLSKEEVLKLFESLGGFVKKGSKMLLFLRQGGSVHKEKEPMNDKFEYIINEYSKEEISLVLKLNSWSVVKLYDKDPIDDPNSLAPNTLVVIAEKE